MRQLSARAGHALRWGTLTTLARFALQLGAQVLLARLLGPAAYGVYALGITVLGLAGYLAGTGFSHSLVLRPTVTELDIRLASTWQTTAGLVCALAMVAAASPLADFFRMPELAPTLRWLALACLLTAASGTALCLMQRELDMRRQGLAQLAAYALGYLGVGLPLALAGWQSRALAVACVVQAGTLLLLLVWLRPHPMRPLWRGENLDHTWATGRAVFFTNGVNWLTANLDRLVIGRMLQAQTVGLYALAWNLAQIPVTLLVGSAQPALLASGTQLARDRRRLAQAWSLVIGAVIGLLPAAALAMALMAPDLVALLYGANWTPAGTLLSLMLLTLPAWTVWALSTPVLWHSGQARREAFLQLPLLVLALPAWVWAASHIHEAGHVGGANPALAVALVSALLLYARAALTLRAALACLGLRAQTLWEAAARGLALAAACGLCVWLGQAAASALLVWPGLSGGPWTWVWTLAATTPTPTPTPIPVPVLAALRLVAAGGACLALIAWLVLRHPRLLGVQARALLRRSLPRAWRRRSGQAQRPGLTPATHKPQTQDRLLATDRLHALRAESSALPGLPRTEGS